MRILRVISSLDPAGGGPVESLIQSSKEHARHGISTSVLVCDDPNATFFRDDRLSHLSIDAVGLGKYGWAYHPDLIAWLRKNLNHFDAVIVHGLWLFPSYAVTKVIREFREKEMKTTFAIFPHGMLDPWFQSWTRRPLKTLRNSFYWYMIEKKVLRTADVVFYTCEQERLLARTTFRGYRCNEQVIPYGTKTPPEFEPVFQSAFAEKCQGLNGRPHLLFLSRIHPKKGVDLLIKAYATLREIVKNEKGEGEGFELPLLVIAGPGLDTSYGRKCLKLCEDLGLSCAIPSATSPSSDPFPSQNENDPVVFFPGLLQGDAKWGAFYGCEAFVLPSHQENFGIVVAEALGCGKPVLISNQVNIWREVKEAGAGLVAEDAESGTRELLRTWLQMTPEAKDRMRTAAQPCFTKNFRVEASADAILRVLRSDQR